METKAKVGARVRAIRRQGGWSQAQLADKTQRSVETISSIERGKALPNFETLERLAEALNVPIKEFFAFDRQDTSARREALLAEVNALALSLSDSQLAIAVGLLTTLDKHRS